VCGWLGRPDPIDAASHGDEAPGIVGPLGLTPDAEAGLTAAGAAALEQAADEAGITRTLVEEDTMSAGEVRRLAVRGIGAVLVRTFSLRAMTFAGNIILARILAPETFGLFAIVNFVVLISAFLADMGIGAALVQRKERLTEEDLRTAFTLGFIVDAAITALLMLLAPVLVAAYNLEPQYANAVRVMALTIMVSTFAIVPAIQMERNLRFKEMANADLVSQIVYVFTAVGLAASGLHVSAFVIASLASRTLHTVIVNIISPWKPVLGVVRARLRAMLAFGVPYQLNGLVLQLKDNFVPTFIAIVSGAQAVGYINWAVGLATNALFLLTIVSRVTFPAYARLQHDLPALKDSIEKSIKWISATVFPAVFMLAALAHQIVRFLYGPKWAPGLISFYLLCIPMIASSYSTVLVSALHGVGRAKTVLKLSTIWAVAGWAISVPLTLWIGYNGFALGMAFVSLLSVLSVIEMNKIVKVTFVRDQLKIALIAGLPAFAVWVMSYQVVHGIPSLLGLGAFGGLSYIGLMALTGEIREARRLVKGSLQRA